MTQRIMTIVGARPQFVKAAPVSAALARVGAVQEVLVHTGQHFDPSMSGDIFRDLGLREPDHHLDINRANLNQMLARMIERIDGIAASAPPDAVLVYGDTTSTLAGAIAAAQRDIPVIHVEAGLRSFDTAMPEERNRVLTDHLAALRLCPTATAVSNLRREGIIEGVRHVGDVMLDTFIACRPTERERSSLLERLGLRAGGYRLATVHRQAATASRDALEQVLDYLRERAQEEPVVLPLHPRTRAAISSWGLSTAGVVAIEPLEYRAFSALLAGAKEVLTDSGGVQKEAYFHRVPCVTLRDSTEWVETITHGWNRLWTTEEPNRAVTRREISEYGDGNAAALIVGEIVRFLG